MRYVSICALLLWGMVSVSAQAVPHFFVRVSQDLQVSGGQYLYEDGKLLRPANYQDSIDIEALVAAIADAASGGDALVYIHGFAAGDRFYERYTAKLLQERIYQVEGSPYGAVVNVMYDTHRIYSKEKRVIDNKAALLAPYLASIFDSIDGEVSIMAHSMGNRLLLGLLDQWHGMCKPRRFKQLVFAAPDLPAEALSLHRHLVEGIADTAAVFRHDTDRVLGYARSTDKKDRLGLDGPSDWQHWPSNTVLLDGSLINDHDSFSVRLTNHRYFYQSKTGVASLRAFLGLSQTSKPTFKRIGGHPHYLIVPSLPQGRT